MLERAPAVVVGSRRGTFLSVAAAVDLYLDPALSPIFGRLAQLPT